MLIILSATGPVLVLCAVMYFIEIIYVLIYVLIYVQVVLCVANKAGTGRLHVLASNLYYPGNCWVFSNVVLFL